MADKIADDAAQLPKKFVDMGDNTFAERVAAQLYGFDTSASNVLRLASSANTLNPTNVKASAGTVDGVKAKNNAAYAVLVSIHNDDGSDADPVDDNLIEVLEFPAGQISAYDFPAGLKCTVGIGFKITKTDGSAVAAGDVTNLSIYYR